MPESTKKHEVRREVEELLLLFELSQVLDRTLDIRDAVEPLLKAVAQRMGLLRGTLTLLNRQNGEISIEAAYGLSPSQRKRGRYRIGEGITGKVIAEGKPAVVPRISEEPMFLDRTGARGGEEFTFICVPIKIGAEVIGALSVDRPITPDPSPQEDLRLLSIVSSMIAQAVRLRQEAQEEQMRLREENIRLQAQLRDRFRPSNILGNSRRMEQVYDLIRQVSGSDATVLIRGESGTGKELVAQAIHYNSPRAARPFVKVSCGALPETIMESELFGHEKGAFTGAVRQRAGRFELANGGTIFLDEIGDISLSTQVKLLRVIQEREFERVGGTETVRSNVRVIAATNRDLEAMIGAGSFRQDLYYRLNVFPIHLPPLRERRTDIPLLADHFAERYGKANAKKIIRISTPAIDMLMSYHWPGNVRELENCIERAVLLSDDGVIHGHHLPPTLQTAEASGTAAAGPLGEALERIEREMISEALKSARGNMARAARALGLTERIMGLRVSKYGINPRRFKPAAEARATQPGPAGGSPRATGSERKNGPPSGGREKRRRE
ncbi:MAG TPA: sigma 54-interacting transcriptional regulator [bacterium]|nr:sigma 54-interacting transcriptional regulator [bacterium]HPQ66039.1 sigma 54-interacting transcriptional regulator [bacterium]